MKARNSLKATIAKNATSIKGGGRLISPGEGSAFNHRARRWVFAHFSGLLAGAISRPILAVAITHFWKQQSKARTRQREHIKDALEKELPLQVHQLLSTQYAHIQTSHDYVRAARDSRKS